MRPLLAVRMRFDATLARVIGSTRAPMDGGTAIAWCSVRVRIPSVTPGKAQVRMLRTSVVLLALTASACAPLTQRTGVAVEERSGAAAERRLSPNFDERKPNYVILHHTSDASAEESLRVLTDPARGVSSHLPHRARRQNLRPRRRKARAWHAGESYWGGQRDLNSASIGIEIDNNGREPFADAQIAALLPLLADQGALRDSCRELHRSRRHRAGPQSRSEPVLPLEAARRTGLRPVVRGALPRSAPGHRGRASAAGVRLQRVESRRRGRRIQAPLRARRCVRAHDREGPLAAVLPRASETRAAGRAPEMASAIIERMDTLNPAQPAAKIFVSSQATAATPPTGTCPSQLHAVFPARRPRAR